VALPGGAAPCGAFHLVGNVAEHLATTLQDSRTLPHDMPASRREQFAPNGRDHRMIAGGSYDMPLSNGMLIGSVLRGSIRPEYGFRCVLRP